MIPARLFGYGELPPELVVVPAWATILTSMFMHGGWLHLGGNMLYLWIFGDNIEDSMGHVRFPIFYLLCGDRRRAGAGLVEPASEIPMIGASGAISGVLGAYILLHPARDRPRLHLPRLLLHRRACAGADRARRLVPAAARQRRRYAGLGEPRRGVLGAYRRLRRRVCPDLPLQAPGIESSKSRAIKPFQIERRRGPGAEIFLEQSKQAHAVVSREQSVRFLQHQSCNS